MAEWKLFYWHSLPGRGDYVRLMFSEAVLKFYRGDPDGFPILAPSVIQKGEFVLSQTPAILQYLGKKLGMYPDGGPEQE